MNHQNLLSLILKIDQKIEKTFMGYKRSSNFVWMCDCMDLNVYPEIPNPILNRF